MLIRLILFNIILFFSYSLSFTLYNNKIITRFSSSLLSISSQSSFKSSSYTLSPLLSSSISPFSSLSTSSLISLSHSTFDSFKLYSSKNIFLLHVEPGTGGEEAELVSSILIKIYSKYCDKKKWKNKLINSSLLEIEDDQNNKALDFFTNEVRLTNIFLSILLL